MGHHVQQNVPALFTTKFCNVVISHFCILETSSLKQNGTSSKSFVSTWANMFHFFNIRRKLSGTDITLVFQSFCISFGLGDVINFWSLVASCLKGLWLVFVCIFAFLGRKKSIWKDTYLCQFS